MGERRHRRCIEPIDDREQLELLCQWPERLTYEEIRPLVLSRSPLAEVPRKRIGQPLDGVPVEQLTPSLPSGVLSGMAVAPRFPVASRRRPP